MHAVANSPQSAGGLLVPLLLWTAAICALAVLLAYAAVHIVCDVPFGEDCTTDSQCECMKGPE